MTPRPTPGTQDNLAQTWDAISRQSRCNFLENNHSNKPRTKPIEIRYHFIREKVQEQRMKIFYCPTSLMIANILTKPLNEKWHANQRQRLSTEGVENKASCYTERGTFLSSMSPQLELSSLPRSAWVTIRDKIRTTELRFGPTSWTWNPGNKPQLLQLSLIGEIHTKSLRPSLLHSDASSLRTGLRSYNAQCAVSHSELRSQVAFGCLSTSVGDQLGTG